MGNDGLWVGSDKLRVVQSFEDFGHGLLDVDERNAVEPL